MDTTNRFPNDRDSSQGTGGNTPDEKPAGTRAENFQVHIPEEELKFGNEDTLHSFSDSYQKDNGEKKKKQDKRQQKKDKREAKARDKIKGRKNRGLFRCVWIAMVILVSIALARYLSVGVDDMLAISRQSNSTATIELKENPSVNDIAQALYDAGAIDNTFFFKLYCFVTGADDGFGAGSFQVGTNLDYEAIISYLQSSSNQQEVVSITFPEGMNLLEIAQKLEDNGVCTVNEVLEASNSDEFDNYDFVAAITNDDERYYKLEGYLFPDTYDFYKGEDPKVALGKMINTCQTRFSLQMRDKAEEKGYTIDEVLTLASIVQAEATDDKDMRMIAGILENRLHDGASHDIYHLECDSTTFYPYRTQDQVPENERDTYKSTYDTYTIEGLPAGPICSPGSDAIEAVLEPSSEAAGMYYFCHDKDGNAYYASTWSQHQANLQEAGLT